jgi:hypothetical protein
METVDMEVKQMDAWVNTGMLQQVSAGNHEPKDSSVEL